MSDSNRVLLSILKETAFGVMPTAGKLADVRYTSDSLGQATDVSQSAEVRADRQISDQIRTNITPQGDINFELSYNNLDSLFEGLAMGAWSTLFTVTATDISVLSGNRLQTVAGDFSGAVVGMWIEVRGFATNASNNGYFKVTVIDLTPTAGELLTVASTLTIEAAGDSVTIKGTQVRNGTTKTSYSIEKHYQDLTNIFDSFNGMRVGSLSLAVASNAIITGSLGFQGKTAAATQTATIGDGTNTTALSFEVMNAIDHVAQITEGGSLVTEDVVAINFTMTNNLRAQPAVGNLGPIGIGLGVINITGNIQVYFPDRSLLNKYRGFTDTALSFRTEDTLGNAYIFDFEKINFTSGDAPVTGQDSDVILDLGFSASFQSGVATESQKMFQLSKFAA